MTGCCPHCGRELAPQRLLLPDRIIAEVAAKHGLTVRGLKTPSRAQRFSHPRHEAMYELKRQTKLSYQQIATRLGLSDHSSVLHGIRVHKKRLEAEVAA